MSRPARLVYLAGALLIGALLGAVADRAWVAAQSRQANLQIALVPAARTNYRHRLGMFEQLQSAPRVVMLGDSITQWGEWPELLGPAVANRGIGGDTSEGLRARLKASVPASATTVAIMIGTNDLKRPHWRPEDSLTHVSAILDRLEGRRVILQSVLYTVSPEENRRIDALNAAYAKLCEAGRCEWLDLNPAVAPAGRLTRAESLDGRHLTGTAYLRWAGVLKRRLGDEVQLADPGVR